MTIHLEPPRAATPVAAPERRPTLPLSGPEETPLLTIAIPTYNRACWLVRSLPIVLAQVEAVQDGSIEVLVADNCSTDETPDILNRLAAQHPWVRVTRNPENLGPEGNFFRVRDLARGRYLWILGDDDVLLPDAVARVTRMIGRGYDYLLFDCMCFDEGMDVCRSPSLLRLRADLPFDRVDRVFGATYLGLGFISINVARRDLFGNIGEAEYRHFAHWGLSFFLDACAAASRAKRGIVVAGPILTARGTSREEIAPNFNYFTAFLEGPHEACEILRERFGFRRRYIRRFKGAILRRMAWRRLAYERLTGELDVASARRILRAHYGSHLFFWLTCVPLLYLPGVGRAVRLAVRLGGGERARRLLARERG